MNIRLLTNVSFATSQYEAGTVLECEHDDGANLVEMGLAELLVDIAPESAMQSAPRERATLPKAKARG